MSLLLRAGIKAEKSASYLRHVLQCLGGADFWGKDACGTRVNTVFQTSLSQVSSAIAMN